MHSESALREPLILGHRTYHDITNDLVKPIEDKAPRMWYILITIAAIIATYGVGCILYLFSKGIGVWGLNKTVDWAWDITNFVWWVGIGHAGTLISAVLLLFRQKWRMAVNRSAEAMTIFAVIMAATFPLIHMGRIWMAYWVFPLPNQFGSLWVNFNSPLLWDVFAISTYFSVSVVFWYIGLIPDFATIRDKVEALAEEILRSAQLRLDGQRQGVAAFRGGESGARGPEYPAGVLGTLGGILRLRHLGDPRLAHDHLPAVLRERCGVQRFRHGADAAAGDAQNDEA